MATLIKEFQVDAEVDAAWNRVAAVGEVDRLFGFLASATLDGDDRRVCETAEGQAIEEHIFSVDAERRRVAYTITSSPFGFTAHAASWEVFPANHGALVRFTIDVLPNAAAEMLDQVIESERATIVRGLSE